MDGNAAGRIRQVGPFAFQQVYEAVHMVPLDQPKNALAMIKDFTLPKEQNDKHEQVMEHVEQQSLDKEAMIKDESVVSIM